MPAQDFFSADTLGTVAGSTAIILVITNTIRRVTQTRTPLIPLAISMIVGFAGAALAHKLGEWPEWVLAFFNSCLLFCTATGAQETIDTGARPQVGGGSELQKSTPVRFFSSWLRND
jgi:hypothetical protein